MGYSIGIQARSKKLYEKMVSFMAKEYRPYWQVMGMEECDCYSSPVTTDLNYIHKKHSIGINYGSIAGLERIYAYILVRWMALRVGRARKTFTDPKAKFDEPVPYLIYDSDSEWPLLQKPYDSISKDLRWCCVDDYGINQEPTSYTEMIFSLPKDLVVGAQKQAYLEHGVTGDEWPWKDSSEEPPGIRWAINESWLKILWPETQKALEPLRKEMERLAVAWTEYSINS